MKRDERNVVDGACIPWLGAICKTTGYGRLTIKGKSVWAHRRAYEEAKGKIPAGYQIDHLCRVRCCVNPDHLEAVTQQENIRRQLAAQSSYDPATHCRHGHEWSAENTRIGNDRNGRSRKFCRTCMATYQRAYTARLRSTS